jgi:2,3-dihydro-2,3-dihydroxybenzoate dehydrogenase
VEGFGLDKKIAVVTGSARGIGEAVAYRLAACGATIAALDADGDANESAAAKILADGGQAHAFTVDVRNRERVDAVIESVENDIGPIEVLVNGAGILRTAPVIDLSDDDWAEVLSVNLSGVLFCSRAVARKMITRRSGAIITIGSNASAVARMSMAAYSSAKAGAVALTRCLGLELAPHGIRCNIVSPGSTNTRMLRALLRDGNDTTSAITGSSEIFRTGIPLAKLAEPQDIADAVVFFASCLAGHVTMQQLIVDGGATLGA